MQKHYVTFYSPGTFFAEMTTKEVSSWDAAEAAEMSKGITERYNARPYGFQFTTRERGEEDFDSKETARSGMYYLGGKVETLEEVRASQDPKDRRLLSNMECNGWDRIVRTGQGWVQPLEGEDAVLEVGP